MIRHIVLWNLTQEARDNQGARRIREALEPLKGKIPQILSMEIGDGFRGSCELCLNATFADRESLMAYIDHPQHVKVKEEVILKLARESYSCDYEF